MKKPIHLPSAGIGALLSVALLALTSGRQPRQEAAAPQAWEYMVKSLSRDQFIDPRESDKIVKAYNDRGADGWEYGGILTPNGVAAAVHIWKRPKKAK